MGQKSKDTLAVRPQSRSGRSRSRSPKPKTKPAAVPQSYASEGVKNNDIFQLPGSDYKLIVLVTMIAAAVRLFRIYQPTSVVFDEVQ
jgi:dolichyl-phosphate-mannose-protein mannosyltransferase